MKNVLFKKLSYFFIIFFFVIILSLLVFRQVALLLGGQQVNELLRAHGSESEFSRIKVLTETSFVQFQNQTGERPWIYPISPYITNRHIPKFLRFPPGALETVFGEGQCESVAASLGFMAETIGYSVYQTNIITNTRAHTGMTLVSPQNESIYIDPLYGLIGYYQGQFLSFKEVQRLILSGVEPGRLFYAVGSKPDFSFYQTITAESVSGFQGQGLVINFTLDKIDQTITLGAVDGAPADVIGAGEALGISPHFHYIGSRYDRSWQRMLRSKNAVKITFIMVGDVQESILKTSPLPEISGNRASWWVTPADPLRLYDDQTPYKWPLHKNYQNIDQVMIEPIFVN
ncbi:MAG: hypothetical protein HOM11_15245 [Methylococcales bacterium]|nr:hypothetical protein [Methylococcales bacterium]MBT7445914.1 hypothetical protein [Methylococcales bacterium]